MAAAQTRLTSGTNVGATQTLATTASVSPSSDCLLCLHVSTDPDGGINVQRPTVSVTGLTNVGSWTFYEATVNYNYHCWAVAKVTGAAGTGTVSMTFAGGRDQIGWDLYQVTGYDTTAPVAQMATATPTSSTASATATFGTAPASDGILLVGAAGLNSTNGNVTNPYSVSSGITEATDTSDYNSTYSFSMQVWSGYCDAGTRPTSITITPTNGFVITGDTQNPDFGSVIAIEVKAAAVGGTAPTAPAAPTATADHLRIYAALASAPADGGNTITDYVWEYAPGPGYSSWTTFSDGTSTALTATIVVPSAGNYKVRVSAVNGVGTSSASTASSAVAVPDYAGQLALENGTFLVLEDGSRLATEAYVSAGFSDTFAGTSINSSNWTVYNRLGDQVNSEINAVIPANVRVSGGLLLIDSKFEDVVAGDTTTGAPNPRTVHYTSGQVAQATAPFLYGDVRVRAKLPGGTGLWPCIWMLGNAWQASQPFTANVAGADWPNTNWWEIDIAEFGNNLRSSVNCQLHFGANHPGGFQALPFDATTRFMVYRLVWTSTSLAWYVDAEDGVGWRLLTSLTGTPGTTIPNTSGYLIIHTAIGGNFGGTPDSATFPQTFQVDYATITQ